MIRKKVSDDTRKHLTENKYYHFAKTFLPFLRWFEGFSLLTLRADLISGITVALVLIPQSMAYAQLADLPAYYGLYAAFLPPTIAAMFGSSNQLATGPVAIVSLMTATALAPLATAGSESFICYAILLALMVGLFQFSLGLLRLGIVVNFLSHPVVNGFTNAAALIIATSQLSKIFGVQVDRYEHHYETVYHVVKSALAHTHWPTLALAALAFFIMYALKRFDRRIPNVLAAVVITTVISFAIGFENNKVVSQEQVLSEEYINNIELFNAELAAVDSLTLLKVDIAYSLKEAKKHGEHDSDLLLDLEHRAASIDIKIEESKEEIRHLRQSLRDYRLVSVITSDADTVFYTSQPPGAFEVENRGWRLKVGNRPLDADRLLLMGGGAVVGVIPQGLPKLSAPKVDFSAVFDLMTMAVVISLLGFMEAISIAKAMAAKTGQRLDPNRELIGQGLGNIVGAVSQCYPVSGSFSRSAVNIQSGALTGLSSAFSSLVVMITLLFFTPLLYHLPQAVLAAIIMMAVIGLINVKGFIHAYQAQKYDGVIAIVSFVGTLAFAPHLDRGIMIGVALSLGHFLFRNIKPDMAILSKYTDGTYRSAERRRLEKCRHIAVVRFNNSLFFANVNYLEDKILELFSTMPELRHVHIVCNGINELDASGEATLSLLITRLREKNIDVSLSGINEGVLDVMARTHLVDKIGLDHIFGNVAIAVHNLYDKTHRNTIEDKCPLLEVVTVGIEVAPDMVAALRKEKWSKPVSFPKLQRNKQK